MVDGMVEEFLQQQFLPNPPPTEVPGGVSTQQEKQSQESIAYEPPREDFRRVRDDMPKDKKGMPTWQDTPFSEGILIEELLSNF